ncbi:phosphotransferase [Actinomadura napierensis]|uniref:Aminoglycoside phosphotransferase domain-containing protein n=1 Tax=Actinomadura napierensis TaxID=267854 RepID=A0ABP5KK42_9ACTN
MVSRDRRACRRRPAGGGRPVARTPSFLETGLYGERPHGVPALADLELDRRLAAFHRRNRVRHPLHGDFYTGNTLARDGRLVAVLD